MFQHRHDRMNGRTIRYITSGQNKVGAYIVNPDNTLIYIGDIVKECLPKVTFNGHTVRKRAALALLNQYLNQ